MRPPEVPAAYFHVDVDVSDKTIRREIKDALVVSVVHGERRVYDATTAQARWSYWIKLENTNPKYIFHLTSLERRIVNGIDRLDGGEPSVRVSEFKLDAIRSDLRITSKAPRWFPCAETIVGPASEAQRPAGGLYTVQRRYVGEVTCQDCPGAGTRYIPVRVSFEVQFPLSFPTTGASTWRRVDWARIGKACELCRPVVMCESVQHHGPVARPPQETFSAADGIVSHAHVLAGLEKVPASVSPGAVEWHRTAACTRWAPVGGTVPSPLPDACKGIDGMVTPQSGLMIQTDGREDDFGGIEPYHTIHHAIPVSCLAAIHKGSWKVTLSVGDVRDEPADVDPLNGVHNGEPWRRWQERIGNACSLEVWSGDFTVTD